MAISKRLRFEVLRRDNHTCRYCGRSAPDVKLTIDHVVPEALGGRDEAGNLVTACSECNGGKTSIAPDSPLVADVAEDALRWGRAIAAAGERMLGDIERRRAHQAEFDRWWSAYSYGPENDRRPVPRPDGWRSSVDGFLAAGLPMGVLYDCLVKAMDNQKIKPTDTFRYMCGIAWSRVNELQESARALTGTDVHDGDDIPLLVEVTEEQSGCTLCLGASGFFVDVLDMLDPAEYDAAIAKARDTPEDERTYYMNEVAEAASNAVSQVIDTRSQLEFAVRRLLDGVPESIRMAVWAQADAEVRKAHGDNFNDYDLATNRLRYLGMWINSQCALAAGVNV